MIIRKTALAAVFVLAGTAANAQLVISGNDGHELEGPQKVLLPDTISIIDMSKYPPKLLGSVAAPASLIGAPVAVAITRNRRLAVVAGGTKADPSDPTKTMPDDSVTVLDLGNPSNPKILQSLHAGAGANGVAINRAETLALVANTNDHSISVFSIAHGKLTPAGTVQLESNMNIQDVAFLPDGKSAVVSGGTSIIRLSVDGTKVAVAGTLEPAIRSTNIIVTANGRYAIVNGAPAPAPAAGAAPARAGRGGRGPAAPPMVSLVDLSSGAVVSQAKLDGGVEGIELSPDGRYLAGVVGNGSHSPPTSAGYNDFGLLQVFSVSDTAITPITDAHTGHWCQGAAWSRDDHTVMVGCSVEGDLEVFHFDGKTLTQDPAATIKVGGRPGTIGER